MNEHEVSLLEPDDVVWITINEKITVRVLQTYEGVMCDIYDSSILKDDMDEAHTAGCYAYFNEVGEDYVIATRESDNG